MGIVAEESEGLVQGFMTRYVWGREEENEKNPKDSRLWLLPLCT
jgi:hypothetical protein